MSLPEQPVALITGAASGLGRALAVALGRRGGRICLTDLPGADLDGAAAETRAAGGQATHCALDVRDPAAFEAAWDHAAATLGPVNLLINNAGIAVAGRVADVPLADWHHQLDVNLFGVVHGCRLAAQRLPAGGALLNVSSGAGLLSPPGMAPYNVSKAAVISLTETLAAELRPSGITCTALAPLFFQTDLMRTARVTDPKIKRAAARLMAKGKLSAADVAEAALRAVERGQLYALPMADGRWYWRLKRALPEAYAPLIARLSARARP